MKAYYIFLIAVLMSLQTVSAQHTKKAHKAAKKVHKEARLTAKDHHKAVKMEKKRVSKHGV
jgi:hypothetical protein